MFDLLDDFKEIDESKTKSNVRRYLNHNFQRLIDRCGISANQLQSPKFSDVPFSKSVSNHSEDNVIRLMEYRELLQYLITAMKTGTDHSILFDFYVLHYSDIKIMQELHISNSTYYSQKNKELLSFADKIITVADLNIYK
ncbi:ArpU family phage packaging/lysis transcriptional regulator [Fructilactobacillus sp. Tb1]|uniref:ArpU family phage packaging/lysis transcriptional regulator n=1 Tax=Fructilactobacillus sp. Tb1 TaxID=3422304 RepID=UPI003D2D6054